ncbi:hypothetical protein RUM44_001456 [Polyplax serrata]|uniref:Molybdopterin synthase catalytic subunit n=1 Tax=Polyplax serrata TaxID=468196 RepID=A0ABR1AKB8_POLSC
MSEIDFVTVKLLFFAKARELLGQKEIYAEVPRTVTGKDLLNFISEKYNLGRLKCNVILALNENWVDFNNLLVLKETDEDNCLIIMNWIKLTHDKLNVESIYNMVCSPEFGAVSLFVGTTRNNFEGKTVTKLEYEAYDQMAVKCLENICKSIREKFHVGNIAIFHRLGDVPIKEASVVIAISSTHRDSSLKAVPYAIDSLKADVPIWKKEIYENEEASKWKENSECIEMFSTINTVTENVNLYEEVVESDVGSEVPSHLIQVKANLEEINRRINSFIHRKREQINMSNIRNFCSENLDNPEGDTCARVSAILKRRKDSKSHLKVHKVANMVGPQTHGLHSTGGSGTSADECSRINHSCPPGAEERLSNVETYLNIHQRSKDVFSRLKAIEDKILFLESISPEYFDRERQEQKILPRRPATSAKRTYSSLDIDTKMQQLEAKLQRKSSTKT